MRSPSLDQAAHAVPRHWAFLTASGRRSVPETAHFLAEPSDGPGVARDAVVLAVAAYYRSEPLARLWDWVVPAPPELGFHLVEFGPQAIGRRMPVHHELSLSGPPTAVDETQELEKSPVCLVLVPVGFGRRIAQIP